MRVAVIGAGRMGTRVALRSARFGCDVQLISRDRTRAARALQTAAEEDGETQAVARISLETSLAEVASAALIYEAIPEDLARKRQLFASLEAIAGSSVPLVSGTSSFSPHQLAHDMKFPARTFVAHFVHPVTLVPLAEVVAPERADDGALTIFEQWLALLRLEPIRLTAPLPGFIVNRLQFALLREALHIVESGSASAADVDQIVRLGLGPRWTATGPLESIALGGAATFADVAAAVVPTLDNRFEISFLANHSKSAELETFQHRLPATERRRRAYRFAQDLHNAD